MTISQLIEQLEQTQKDHGDLLVYVQSFRKFYVHIPSLKVETPDLEADASPEKPRLILEACSA